MSLDLYRAAARARGRPRRGAGRAGTGGAPQIAARSPLQGPTEPVPLRPMEHSIAAKYAARPAARFVRPSARDARAAARPPPDRARSAPPRHASDRPAPSRRRAARQPPRPAGASIQPAAPRATGRAAARGRASRCTWARSGRAGDGPPPGRRRGAVARLRTATATSAGGIVVRHEGGRAMARRRQPPARARRPDVDPAQGHARARRDHARRRPCARSREETGPRGPDHRRRSTRSSTASSRPGTRIHKTVHYFLMEPIGGDLAGHDHEFDEVRWIPFAEAAVDADASRPSGRSSRGPRSLGSAADGSGGSRRRDRGRTGPPVRADAARRAPRARSAPGSSSSAAG